MLLSLTVFSPRLTDALTAETDIFNLLDNFVMFRGLLTILTIFISKSTQRQKVRTERP